MIDAQTWAEPTPEGQVMEQASYQALAPNFRAWQTQRAANQRASLWCGRPPFGPQGRPTVQSSSSVRLCR